MLFKTHLAIRKRNKKYGFSYELCDFLDFNRKNKIFVCRLQDSLRYVTQYYSLKCSRIIRFLIKICQYTGLLFITLIFQIWNTKVSISILIIPSNIVCISLFSFLIFYYSDFGCSLNAIILPLLLIFLLIFVMNNLQC